MSALQFRLAACTALQMSNSCTEVVNAQFPYNLQTDLETWIKNGLKFVLIISHILQMILTTNSKELVCLKCDCMILMTYESKPCMG